LRGKNSHKGHVQLFDQKATSPDQLRNICRSHACPMRNNLALAGFPLNQILIRQMPQDKNQTVTASFKTKYKCFIDNEE
jgi:hypothetical protein